MHTSAGTSPRARRATAVVSASNAATLLSTVSVFTDDLERLVKAHAEIDKAFRDQTQAAVTEIRRRLGRDELWVAVVGEFKAGKSTFLNALLGAPLLGTAKAEYTGVNTVLRYGAECDYAYETERGKVVRFADEVPDQRARLQKEIASAERQCDDVRKSLSAAELRVQTCERELSNARATAAAQEAGVAVHRDTTERMRLARMHREAEAETAAMAESSSAALVPGFLRADARWWAVWIWFLRFVAGWIWRREFAAWRSAVATSERALSNHREVCAQLESTTAAATAAENELGHARWGVHAAETVLGDARRTVQNLQNSRRSTEDALARARRELETHTRERLARFRENIRSVAAIDRRGDAVRSLTVWYPSPLLQTGLVLLDTPGVNTPQKKFEARAWEAIERDADACVLLTPVSQALSLETRKALKRMRDYVPHIALAITKVDKATQDVFSDDPDEVRAQVEEVLRGAVQGYAREMGRTERDVFWIATAAERAVPETPAFSDRESREFAAAIESLTRALASERAAVLGVRAAKLGAVAVQHLREEVERVERVYAERIEKLESERLPDPNAEAERLSKGYRATLRDRLKEVETSRAVAIDGVGAQWMLDIEAAIQGRREKKTLEQFASGKLEKRIEELRNRLNQQLSEYLADASAVTRAVATNALEEVHQRYRIVARTSKVSVPAQAVEIDASKLLDGARVSVSNVLAGHSDENLYAAGGGATAGAVIGTFLLPGIGTVIGGVLGGIAGSLFGPSLDDLKAKLIANCRGVVENALTQAKEQLATAAKRVRADGKRTINDALSLEVSRFAQWIESVLRDEERLIEGERKKLQDLLERAQRLEASGGEMTRLSAAIAKESALMARSPQPS